MIAARTETAQPFPAFLAPPPNARPLPGTHVYLLQNSRLGLFPQVPIWEPGFLIGNHQNALGLPAELRQTRVGSRCSGKERDQETGLDYFGARYLSSAQGRWTSPDAPLADQHRQDPQTWNLYGYVRGNPLRLIDTDGRRIAVIENGPTQGNPIGHTSIAITGKGVFSFGTVDRQGKPTQLGSSMTDYMTLQAGRRDTKVSIINTTPAQDQAAADALVKQNDKGAIGMVTDNCSSRSNAALDAAGVPGFPVVVDPLTGTAAKVDGDTPGTAGLRTKLLPEGQVQTVDVPKGTTEMPKVLDEFNPKPDVKPIPQNKKPNDGSSS